MRFWTHQMLYLGYYAFKTGRNGLGLYYIACMLGYAAGGYFLYLLNPVGTLWMVAASFGITGLLLMQVGQLLSARRGAGGRAGPAVAVPSCCCCVCVGGSDVCVCALTQAATKPPRACNTVDGRARRAGKSR